MDLDQNEKEDVKDLEYEIEEIEIEQGWNVSGNFLEASIHFQSETVANEGLKPWEENKKTADLWEGGYLTVEHPGKNGDGIVQDPDDVVGRIQDVEVDEENKRLNGTAKIPLENPDHTNHTDEEWGDIIDQVKQRDKISAGYFYKPENSSGSFERNGKEMEYEFIKRDMLPDHIALLESDPACPRGQGCGIDLEKIQMEMEDLDQEEIMGDHSPPPIEDETWDGDEAEQQLRNWASDGDPDDKENMNWDRYFQGFLYRDEDNKENFTAYKMPHHKIRNGELVTSEQGVLTAGSVMEGARGGVDIPEDEMDRARSHLRDHYEQFDRIPPWDEESEEDDQEESKMDALDKIEQGLRELVGKEKETMEKAEDENEPLCDREEETDNENQDDEVNPDQQVIEGKIEKLREEKEELEEQLEKYREQERERLEKFVQEKTDLSDEEIEGMEKADLELLLKGAESSKIPSEGSGNETESGKNLNSEPGMKDSEIEDKKIPDLYWKNQKEE